MRASAPLWEGELSVARDDDDDGAADERQASNRLFLLCFFILFQRNARERLVPFFHCCFAHSLADSSGVVAQRREQEEVDEAKEQSHESLVCACVYAWSCTDSHEDCTIKAAHPPTRSGSLSPEGPLSSRGHTLPVLQQQ